MSSTIISSKAPQNSLLAGLSAQVYSRFEPHLEFVSLPVGKILMEPGEPMMDAYFITSGMISLVAILRNGDSLEVGVVGREGVADVNVLLGCETSIYRAIVQVAATGLRIKASVLTRLYNESSPQARQVGQQYIQFRINQVTQSAICNHAHAVEERLARWLLTTADTVGEDYFDLTHEFLSQMLGVRRSSVTLAAGVLSAAGLIKYTRGHIVILKRPELEDLACECYSILRNELESMMRP
jgi:CRP-like cAMP-binding protein